MTTQSSVGGVSESDAAPAWAKSVDAAGFVAFRVLLGLVLAGAILRFAAKGWIDVLLVKPAFQFRYLGLGWLPLVPSPVLHALFALLFASALGIAARRTARVSAALFCLLFTYCETIDQTLYLNHYYLVSLLTAMVAWLPSPRRTATLGSEASLVVPRGVYWALRCQVGFVYFYAGLAKLSSDWLLHAEPLRTWLATFAGMPIVGPWLAAAGTAYAMSWLGAAFDLAVPFLLCWRRSRPAAYAVLVVFHAVIWWLFPVGVFSWVMVLAATVFFEPNWPRVFAKRLALWRCGPLFLGLGLRCRRLLGERGATAIAQVPARAALPLWAVLMLVHLTLQALLPLRHWAYPGDVNWTNEGFRFAWRVMLVEKVGQVEFLIETAKGVERVYPERGLTRLQYAQMSIQPDMILQYARHLAEPYRAQGLAVAVRADAWASLNGRPAQRLIDPLVDLAREARSFQPAQWIVPLSPAE